MAQNQSQPAIPGSRVLEEVGKLHVQLSVAEGQIEALTRANSNLAQQLKEALAKVANEPQDPEKKEV